MKRWTPRQLIALILGVLFALGVSLSAVQAADMAAKMTAAAMDAAAADRCNGGCGGDDNAMSAGSCVMVCPNSVQAVVPAVGPVVMHVPREAPPISESASAGRSSRPDPYPPKSVLLI